MELLKIFFSSIGSILVLFILTKLIGNKQMSQLNMFDYINGITIGSIAAEMATSLDSDFMHPLLAMLLYALAALLFSYINSKSLKSRRVLMGCSAIILHDGKLYKNALKKNHLDISEFLIQCRLNGFFDLEEIELAVFEPNGAISFLPKAEKRPVNNDDLKLKPDPASPCVSVIIDGKVLERNLTYMGRNREWLEKQLKSRKIDHTSEVFLATLSKSGQLEVFIKNESMVNNDIFQ